MKKPLFLALAVLAGLSSPAAAAGLKPDFAVCRSREQVDQIVRASVAGEISVIDDLLAKGVCRGTTGGERVTVISRNRTYATVTLGGSKQRWVTVVEALR